MFGPNQNNMITVVLTEAELQFLMVNMTPQQREEFQLRQKNAGLQSFGKGFLFGGFLFGDNGS